MKTKKKVIISMLAVTATLALGAFMGGCSLSDKIEQWKCDHENITENVVIDPTCYEKGELKETCDDCGKTWTEDIEKVAHTWNDGEVVVEATCTETGITRYTCTVEGCEAVEDRITDKIEHTRVEMPAVAPTCTTVGYTEWYKCGDCGLVLTKKQEIPALGHVETELQAVAPTCTETGLTAGVGCATCGEVITAQTVVPATGHNLVTVAGKPATCTETGLTDGQACEDCGKVYVEQTEIPATGHKDSDGDFSCDICGINSLNEVVPVSGECVAGKTYRIYPAQNFDGGDVYPCQPELCVTVTLLDGTTRNLYVTVCGEKFHEFNQSGFVFEDSFGDGYRDVTFKVGTYTALDMNDDELTFVIDETSVICHVCTSENPDTGSVGYVRRLESATVANEES